ncbi:MAG: head completion/stabilization protein [Pseudohongiellaceae bacterium]
MSLIEYGTGSEPPAEDIIQNTDFWPDIDPGHFRGTQRVDSGMTSARVLHQLRIAISDVNRRLQDWQAAQVEEGAQTVDDLVPPVSQPADFYQTHYLQAVYCTAHAALLERYRDYSATSPGESPGEMKDLAADDYRRDAHWAVARIIDTTNITVELI